MAHIILLAINLAFLAFEVLGLSFHGTYTDAIVSVVLGLYALFVLSVTFKNQLGMLFGLYVLCLFLSIFLLFIVNNIFNIPRWLVVFLSIAPLTPLVYFLLRKQDQIPRKIGIFFLSFLLVIIGIRSCLFLSPIGVYYFYYKSPSIFSQCIRKTCVNLHQMNTGFFFGNNYLMVTKDSVIPFIEIDVQSLSFGQEPLRDKYLEEKGSMLILHIVDSDNHRQSVIVNE